MTIQTITTHPHQELFGKLKEIPVKDIQSDTFGQIGSSMLEILKKKGGIGLSANQVGLPFRMCVIDINVNNPQIMINPRIAKQSDKMAKSQEGCLSLPGLYITINRHKNITVEYEDVTGETQSEEATGLLSFCIQHEIDHLNGILMINRLSEYHKSKAMKQLHKFKKGMRR
jgi:peptide deformylase